MKRNQPKRNQTKRNQPKRNQIKRNQPKRNQQNETNQTKPNETKQNQTKSNQTKQNVKQITYTIYNSIKINHSYTAGSLKGPLFRSHPIIEVFYCNKENRAYLPTTLIEALPCCQQSHKNLTFLTCCQMLL